MSTSPTGKKNTYQSLNKSTCKAFLGMTLDGQLRWEEHVKKKRVELGRKFKKMCWVLERHCELSLICLLYTSLHTFVLFITYFVHEFSFNSKLLNLPVIPVRPVVGFEQGLVSEEGELLISLLRLILL